MKQHTAPSFPISIYIAGQISKAHELIAAYCMEHGACFTLRQADYIYTGGSEPGMIVGLINYPRFLSSPEALTQRAVSITKALIDGLHQHSATVETPEQTIWLTRRPEDQQD